MKAEELAKGERLVLDLAETSVFILRTDGSLLLEGWLSYCSKFLEVGIYPGSLRDPEDAEEPGYFLLTLHEQEATELHLLPAGVSFPQLASPLSPRGLELRTQVEALQEALLATPVPEHGDEERPDSLTLHAMGEALTPLLQEDDWGTAEGFTEAVWHLEALIHRWEDQADEWGGVHPTVEAAYLSGRDSLEALWAAHRALRKQP